MVFLIEKAFPCLIYAIQNSKTYFEDIDNLIYCKENLVKVPEIFYRNIIDKNVNGQLRDNESLNSSHMNLINEKNKQNFLNEIQEEKSFSISKKNYETHFDEINFKDSPIKSKLIIINL